VGGCHSVTDDLFGQSLEVRFKRLSFSGRLIAEFLLGLGGKLNGNGAPNPRAVCGMWSHVPHDTIRGNRASKRVRGLVRV